MYDPVGDGKMAFPPSNALQISMSSIADMQFSLIGTCGGDGGGDIGGDGGLWQDTTHRYINTIRNRIVTFTITV
tara:strand:- start:2002 stop:2223 length:222 start_codon:yes stop_codon:yes gene_type:complete